MVKIKGSGINSKKYFGPWTVVNYIGRINYELNYNGKTFRRNELQMKLYPQREAQSIHRETNVISNSTCTKQDDNLVEPNNQTTVSHEQSSLDRYTKRTRCATTRYGFNLVRRGM